MGEKISEDALLQAAVEIFRLTPQDWWDGKSEVTPAIELHINRLLRIREILRKKLSDAPE